LDHAELSEWDDLLTSAFTERLITSCQKVTIAGPAGCEDRPWWWGYPEPEITKELRIRRLAHARSIEKMHWKQQNESYSNPGKDTGEEAA
jgi:hypothetical protein